MVWAPPSLTIDPLSSNSWRRPEDAGLQIRTSVGSVNSLGNSPAKRGSFSHIETTNVLPCKLQETCPVYITTACVCSEKLVYGIYV